MIRYFYTHFDVGLDSRVYYCVWYITVSMVIILSGIQTYNMKLWPSALCNITIALHS